MKAIAIIPGTREVRIVDRPEPELSTPDEIKLRVLLVGICGTDREEVSGGRADAPPGQKDLVIGHEMFGQVVEAGSQVQSLRPGDFGCFTVRRGCGRCSACLNNRSDMCSTGDYTERGIRQRDGYETELVVDQSQYFVRVPSEQAALGVLSEPTSVAEKAIDEALSVQAARIPGLADPRKWLEGRQVLVAGMGPIGLLAAVALRLRGAEVLGMDVVDADTLRPRILQQLGGKYVDGRQTKPSALDSVYGQIDMIFEATGIARVEFDLLGALGINGVYVLTGIPGGDRPVQIDGAALMRQLVLRNQVMIGSVNASRKHFEMAVEDLGKAYKTWRKTMEQIITHVVPCPDFAEVLEKHPDNEIKAVVEWSKPS
ncbi:MAG: alcohol dehydrogenase [Acidobacteria bacterium]|nr:MAG: alcohol dehydrogenase [Acidobacteriota bacterium]